MIAVATLLVAVVGATFAYFTATNSQTDEANAKVDVATKEVGGTTFTLSGSEIGNKLDYPGGIAIIKAVATAKKDSADDTNNYDFEYSLNITANVGSMTGVKWTLYEFEEDPNVVDTDLKDCNLVNDTTSETGKTLFYYSTAESDKAGESPCSITGLKLNTKLITEKASGTITSDTVSDQSALKNLSIEGVTDNTIGKSKYYYLVVEYPNSGEEQNSEMGSKGNISLTLVNNSVTAEIAGA